MRNDHRCGCILSTSGDWVRRGKREEDAGTGRWRGGEREQSSCLWERYDAVFIGPLFVCVCVCLCNSGGHCHE